MKKIAFLCAAFLVVLALVACSNGLKKTERKSESLTGRIQVAVTFNALSEMANAVGGDFVEVSTIVPDGIEPHDFEPKAQDLVLLGKARVFVYNGCGLEYWVKDALAAAQNDALIVVDSSDGIEPIVLANGHDGKDLAGAQTEGVDPHIWLGLSCAQVQAANIAKALISADPVHADAYDKNAKAFIASLEALRKEYAVKFGSSRQKAFVTGHAAFGYLCRDFGLEQNSVEDVFASGEPNAQAMVKLVSFAKEKGVKTVFVEEMVSPAVSQTLASEVGAKVQTIYTLESSEGGLSYIDRVRANLEAIYLSTAE